MGADNLCHLGGCPEERGSVSSPLPSLPRERFAVRVVVPDPEPVGFGQVEARIVIDGIPVAAAAFGKGPASSPEQLVYSGQLEAGTQPREVMLAEAYCTEGCCGALYVTIAREADEVVWTNWRTPVPDSTLAEARFNAAGYDREVARAETDQEWEWPARTLARLIDARLRSDPSILGQWDCQPGWCTAWLKDFDATRLTFSHPARWGSFEDPHIQFGMVIKVADHDPRILADQIIESLRSTDPKTTADIIGGSKDAAEKLGLTHRPPTRW